MLFDKGTCIFHDFELVLKEQAISLYRCAGGREKIEKEIVSVRVSLCVEAREKERERERERERDRIVIIILCLVPSPVRMVTRSIQHGESS